MSPGTSVGTRCYSLGFFDAFRCSVDDNARPFELEIIHNYCLGNVRRSNWLYFDIGTHSICIHFFTFFNFLITKINDKMKVLLILTMTTFKNLNDYLYMLRRLEYTSKNKINKRHYRIRIRLIIPEIFKRNDRLTSPGKAMALNVKSH